MARIVVVHSDAFIRGAIVAALEAQRHTVHGHDADAAIDRVVEVERPDLVVLEVPTHPDTAGSFTLGRRLRMLTSVPLIVLAESDRLDDRITAFDLGADDVLPSPFAIAELIARLEAVLRRSDHSRRPLLMLDDILVDELAHTVVRSTGPIELTSLEFALLVTMMRHRGQVLSKPQLLNEVWGYDHFDVNLVEVHVSALRRKLEASGPRVIHTVRGAGYVVRATSADVSSANGNEKRLVRAADTAP